MSDNKVYPVPPDFAAQALVNAEKYKEMYAASIADPEKFWGERGQAPALDPALHQGEERQLGYFENRQSGRPASSNGSRMASSMSAPTASTATCPLMADKTAIIFEGDSPGESRNTSPMPSSIPASAASPTC